MAKATEVPQEIWWLVCQDLKRQQDFKSLFNCALVNSSWATHALPLLYSIHDSSSAVSDDMNTTINGRYKWGGLWRSIILSSIGVTAYPYCLWIKSLVLGDLETLLSDIAITPDWRSVFFQGPMATFEIRSGSTKTRAGKPILEWQKIIEKVADSITKYIKEASDDQNKTVQLTSLEGANLPTSMLCVWVSRLSILTSLSIRDGSVLSGKVAESIRKNCPLFKDLTCFNIRGPTVDQNMSAFFRGLRENSLERFRVLSSNEIGFHALEGLMYHSRSLQTLVLSSLENTSLPFLHLLTSCEYLENLDIEASTFTPLVNWATYGKDPLLELSSWLKGCKSLKRLGISKLSGASKLLSDVLKSPDLRLKELEVILMDDDEAFYSALRNQGDLESLMFRSNAEVVDSNRVRHDHFLDSICSCKNLKDLNIIQQLGGIDQVQLTPDDLFQIKNSLPDLESLSFEGEYLDDSTFEPLSQMNSLTTLNINGWSLFTFSGIISYIQNLIKTGSHHGFSIHIMNQLGDAKIEEDQAEELSRLVREHLGGRFDLVYFRDPEEDSMTDLSD